MKVALPAALAPEGRKILAQGVSPGSTEEKLEQAPDGATDVQVVFLSPLRGSVLEGPAVPRLAPWDRICRPL